MKTSVKSEGEYELQDSPVTERKEGETARKLRDMSAPFGQRSSIRVRDKLSLRVSLNLEPQPAFQNRMTFRASRRSSSVNDFTAALMQLPEEGDGCIIFPWDEEYKEFVIEDEAKVNSVHVITREEIDLVFERLKASPYHDLYGNMHYKLIIPFVILLAVIVIILVFFQDSFKFVKNSNSVIGVFFVIFGILFLMIVLVSIFWARYLKSRLAQREVDFTRILNEINSEIFCDKDVFWKCGKLGTYVQLDLNYKFKALEDSPTLEKKGSNGSRQNKPNQQKISISMNLEQTSILAEILDHSRKQPRARK